jgi:hypothetical protein
LGPPAAERFPAISRHFPIPHDEDTTMTFAKLSSTALAAGLVAGAALFAGGAHAQGVAKFSGATAFSINQARALALLCNNASGLADIYKSNNNSTNNLGNVFTVKCSVNFQNGGGADEARINVAGGSFSAVLNRTGNDNATPVTLLSAALCAAQGTTVNVGAGTGPLNWINNATIRLFHCPAAAAVQADTTDGGVLDVEGSIFTANGLVTPSQVNAATDYLPSGFLQAFAFPLSRDLYNAMQAHQTAQGRLPASCATVVNIAGVDTFTASGSTLPECQPSVNRSSIASMMVAGNNDVKRAGANHFIGGTAALKNDLPANRAISPDMALNSRFVYCRRPATSGTQAAAQLYFLNTPTGSGELGGQLAVVGLPTAPATANLGNTFRVTTNSGTGDVRTCLNNVVAGTNFSGGVVSAENNPLGGTDTYRFAKLNGVHIADGVAGSAQTAEAIAGRYDFVFEAIKYCPGGVCSPLLDAIDNVLPVGASTPGLYLRSEAQFTRGGLATAPLRAKQ